MSHRENARYFPAVVHFLDRAWVVDVSAMQERSLQAATCFLTVFVVHGVRVHAHDPCFLLGEQAVRHGVQ